MTENPDQLLKKNPTEVVLFPETRKVRFRTLAELIEFLESEIKFWESYSQLALGNQVYQFVVNAKQNVANVKATADKYPSAEDFLNAITSIVTTFSTFPFLSSTCELVGFMRKLSPTEPINFLAGVNFVLNLGYYNYNEPRTLKAAFHGALYTEAQKYLTKTATSREEAANTALSELIESRRKQTNEIDAEWIAKNELLDQISNEKIKENLRFQEEASKLLSDHDAKLKAIQILYSEKMRIDGPAAYWKKFKTKYQWSGIAWLFLAGIGVAFLVWLGNYLLTNLPDKLFTDKPSFENTLRWAVIFLLMTSMLIFLITTSVKLALSSLHLSRDANERLQLTHQFLALLKEGAIDSDERKIILQSLFARAESGLLKHEQGPTLPDGAVGQILKAIRGNS